LLTDPATPTPILPPLHDALPISHHSTPGSYDPLSLDQQAGGVERTDHDVHPLTRLHDLAGVGEQHPVLAPWLRVGEYWMLFANTDRKSTRLNSSHGSISYAVFCF